MEHRIRLLAVLAALAFTACGGDSRPPAAPPVEEEEAAPVTNRIDVPPPVRRNLGITFAKVTPRHVATTLRVPGRFEFLPQARRAYHATLAGEVELLVSQYDPVKPGVPLFRVDSPDWRDMQKALTDTINKIRMTSKQLEALERRSAAVTEHRESLEEQEEIWRERLRQVESLNAAGGGVATARTEARAALASVHTSLAEVAEEEADVEGQRIMLQSDLRGHREASPLLTADALGEPLPTTGAAVPRHDLGLSRAAALLGVDIATLRENAGTDDHPVPRWRTIDRLEVVADRTGVVEAIEVTPGSWVDAGGIVLQTVDVEEVRFRAAGLQSDLGRLREGLTVSILPPDGSPDDEEALRCALNLGLEANPISRRVDLVVVPRCAITPVWARPGVSTEMEVVLDETGAPQLAVPRGSVIQDGLQKIIFRRDPKDPDKVIRIEADLGISDGRWVVVESGLMEGDEVVLDGIYELMLVGGGPKQMGGHFHADGTFHAEDH